MRLMTTEQRRCRV